METVIILSNKAQILLIANNDHTMETVTTTSKFMNTIPQCPEFIKSRKWSATNQQTNNAYYADEIVSSQNNRKCVNIFCGQNKLTRCQSRWYTWLSRWFKLLGNSCIVDCGAISSRGWLPASPRNRHCPAWVPHTVATLKDTTHMFTAVRTSYLTKISPKNNWITKSLLTERETSTI